METLKTALVVVLLLAVLYGVWVVLNKPDFNGPPELAEQDMSLMPPTLEFDTPSGPPAAFPQSGTQPPEMPKSMTPIMPTLPNEPQDATSQFTDRPTITIEDDSPATDANSLRNSNEPIPTDLPASRTPTFPAQPAGATVVESSAPPAYEDDLPPSEVEPLTPPENEVSRTGSARSIYEMSPSEPPPLTDAPAAVAETAPVNSGPPGPAFEEVWADASRQVNSELWADALLTLSSVYHDQHVTGEQRRRMMDLLDPLAGKVIYSTEHLLDPPYQVRPGETLQQIAASYQVPASLLANINGVSADQPLSPDTTLKVLRGPFRAEVQLNKDKLVLFLGKYYAGEFAMSPGNTPVPQPGEYVVNDKAPGREFSAPDGSLIPAMGADNPYGRWWIDLGNGMCIHGTAQRPPLHGGLGCISLDTANAADVYGILSIGSRVVIR